MKIRTFFLCLIGILILILSTGCSSAPATGASSTSTAVTALPAVEVSTPTSAPATPTQEPRTATISPATPTSAQSSSGSSALDGAALVQERCTVCHSTNRIHSAAKTMDEWQVTVERMIGHGASLNSEEEAAVIKYLAATYHP